MKTSELTGALLDYWVAKAEGALWRAYDEALEAGTPTPPRPSEFLRDNDHSACFTPSTKWAHGGPIIDRERPHALESCNVGAGWYVRSRHLPCDGDQFFGETLLIAAMRAYVASKFGKEVPEA